MKRSVLIPCFLLILTLSSLCLLSSRINPVYASSEQILNGSFEDHIRDEFDYWGNTGWMADSDPHSGSVNLWGYSSYCKIGQLLAYPVDANSITSFGYWAKGNDDSLGCIVRISYGEEGFSEEWHNFGANPSLYYFIDLTGDIPEGIIGVYEISVKYHNSYYSAHLDDFTLYGVPLGSPIPVSLDIQGDPELNYDFLMNGSAYTTPYSNSNFTSGNVTLENSSPSLTVGHFIYTFSYWSINGTDNLTSSSFTVDIGGNTTISLVFSKAIMDIVFDPRTIASETVHLADTGSQLGKMLGVNSFIGGLIMSAIICAIFLFPVMIFKRTLLPMVIMGFLGLAISTGLGFLPFWIDLVLLLIISILFSGKIRDAITGATN